MDPRRTLRIDEDLRRAGASHEARAAANIACLDIMGKATRASVYEVLGGPTRTKVRALAAVSGGSAAELRTRVHLAAVHALQGRREDASRALSHADGPGFDTQWHLARLAEDFRKRQKQSEADELFRLARQRSRAADAPNARSGQRTDRRCVSSAARPTPATGSSLTGASDKTAK